MANERRQGERKKWVSALLAVALGIDLLLVGYVGYLLWGRMFGQTEAAIGPTRVPIELWNAYEQARAAARTEAEDAQLVSASTQWQAVSEQTLVNGASNWSFVFHSPTDDNSLDVVVNAGKAQVVNRAQVWVAPKSLAEGAWRAGPREPLLVFLAYGGRTFLAEHPQALVDLHLASGEDDDGGGAVWTVVALDPEDRSMSALLIDAETKQVLSN